MAIINIPKGGGTADSIELVASVAALPPVATVPIGASRVTADTGTLYISDGSAWNPAGGGPSGVASWNGFTGVVSVDTDDLPEGATNLYTTAANINAQLSLPTTRFVITDSSGNISTLSGWGYNSLNGATVALTATPNGSSGNEFVNNINLNVAPTGNSPDQQYTTLNLGMNLDSASTGFEIGTNGGAGILLNLGYQHGGSSDTGSLNYILMNSNIGNGTDPITVEGFTYSAGFLNIAANVTMEQGLQGYTFQPSINASAVVGSNWYMHAFGDFAQMSASIPSPSYYQSFKSSPTIGTIQASASASSFDATPTINVLNGFYSAISTAPTINGGSGGVIIANLNATVAGGSMSYQGLLNQPNVTTSGNVTLHTLSTSSVTSSGTVIGQQLSAGSIQHQASDITGRTSTYVQFPLASSLGQLQAHVLGGEMILPDSTAITGTTILFNNLAATVDLGNATSTYTGDGLVDLTNVGFVGQIVGDGDATGLNYLLVGFSAAHDGNVDAVRLVRAAGIPGGGSGTIGELVGFEFITPFGAVSTDTFGFKIDSTLAENYIARSLAIGDMVSKKVTNSSVALEVDSTTKAFLNARMTTTERNALTAVNGMQIYNTSTDKLQVYAAGSWVDLH